jgi:alpha-1,3-glucan synthase
MGDLIAFDGFENETAPFEYHEHKVHYKTSRQYLDFQINNTKVDCEYPRFWDETGQPVNQTNQTVYDSLGTQCYDSDFDHYGDVEAFGVFPDWQRSLAKFASVQDRLRDWKESVRKRLEVFSCITVEMLDIDGFRYDKATQITVDALAQHNHAVRTCAANVGKDNFFLPGEITGGNGYGSIYLGRGRQGDQKAKVVANVLNWTTATAPADKFIRDKGLNALDAAAFHYSVYRFLTRFLGMDGNLEAGYDTPSDWVAMWSEMILSNDLINPNTGEFDPRHLLGTTNQDVFRWPAIEQGVERMLLGQFITTIHMPGAPLVYYGEEQAMYVLDSTAENYIFSRQAMSATPAWMLHGCHAQNSSQYVGWPIGPARTGCLDETVSYDHRDPSHPVRNIMKSMYAMRDNYPGLQEGWLLQHLSNSTDSTILPGSVGSPAKDGVDAIPATPTIRGVWSVVRAFWPGVQDQFATNAVWLVYHNRDEEQSYTFDCSKADDGLIAPFVKNTPVKNLFYPYDELKLLGNPSTPLGIGGVKGANGCLDKITMKAFEYRAYVETSKWVGPPPMITKFTPGHDAPVPSADTVHITFEFSQEMDCDEVAKVITIEATVEGSGANTKLGSHKCTKLDNEEVVPWVGAIPSNQRWEADLTGVVDGVYRITLKNAPTANGKQTTNSTDHFFLRVGGPENPITYPLSANYSKTLLTKEGSDLYVNHKAAGADMWRYSTNWGSTYSNWTTYTGGKTKIDVLPWSGTKKQEWKGDHVIVQYHSKLLGSSAFRQEGDVGTDQKERRFPHIFAHGEFNKFGFDAGVRNQMALDDDGQWSLHFIDEWPTKFQLNVWGMNPDGKPDASFVYGDVDGDFVLDRMPPSSLADNSLNISSPPQSPALSYRLVMDDRTLQFKLEPQGHIFVQIIMFILLATLPVAGGLFAVWIFMGSFYKVKINKIGFKKRGRSPFRGAANRLSSLSFENFRHKDKDEAIEMGVVPGKRRKVIIATMEYNIDDWNIKIKIGGLGVMAQLMGKALEHQDLIWVVPCVGGIDYPVDQRAEPMYVPIMGKQYEIEVQYHQVGNITYVLLDAPIFRTQSKTDPYPPRMDDIESAIYYSAWNYCIAEAIRRFNPDLYHINDYHGAAAPLYLLPDRTIPCALSLHNAEFQGMWPMRNPEESKEVCEVFNLDPEIVKEYVQFGSVFNLLHAGASYLRVNQKGFGAVGVSKKYGDRSYARYPIFWGLSKIGQLPNPDPSDTAEWTRDEEVKKEDVVVDQEAESKRGELRKQAQEWAGLNVDPNADLFVFVGRWSLQKGVDLIADIFPSILEKYPSTQLIAVGPVIDLYGKFAALKLETLMKKYPGRVYSKPEFTALPPYIFSGAEFALIPSRDEPFGLVAVEFGRKGALGVGARVGGLGQMPGFWYTIESTAPQHLLHQFREAIVSALESKQKTRVKMRAWSAKQRFPVKQWVEDLDTLQGECIRLHWKEAKKHKKPLGGNHGPRLTVPSEVDLHGQPRGRSRGGYTDLESEAESRGVSPNRSRASSMTVPYISEPTEHNDDDGDLGRRSTSQPLGSPGTPGSAGEEAETFLPVNPMFQNHSARSSVSSLATVTPGNDPGNRLSVDTFAMRMMSADPSETRPQAFALNTNNTNSNDSNNNPQARPDALRIYNNRNSSRLSVVDVVGDRQDFKLQKVDPFFTDSTGEYYKEFEAKLGGLTAKNSDTDLCIDDYLKQSEKQWFKEFRDAKLGRTRSPSRTREGSGLIVNKTRSRSRVSSMISVNSLAPSDDDDEDDHHRDNANLPQTDERDDEFLLGTGYKAPRGLKKLLQIRVGDWPVYSFILALGQILAANSYQIVLLAGEAGQTPVQLYIVAGTYAVTSVLWWLLFRRLSAHYILSLPWLFYGLAFLFIGVTPFLPKGMQSVLQDVATAAYATGASSGALFFALNFGDEGMSPPPALVTPFLPSNQLLTWFHQAAPPSWSGSSGQPSSRASSSSTSSACSTGAT